MPYTPTAPTTEQVMVPQDHALDTYWIHSYEMRDDPNDSAAISVRVAWSKGFMDGGTYHPCQHFTDEFVGQAVVDAVGSSVIEGNTRYEEDKSFLWGLLIGAGKVSAGVVS